MNQSIAQEISLLREAFDQQSDWGIVLGQHQNLDTIAGALALYLSLVKAGKKVQIISKKEPTVEVSNLVGIDKIKQNFVGNTSKLVISLPYIKGEVEKVLFTEFPDPQNPTNINFHLTAAADRSITPFDLNDVKLIWEGGAPQAIISIGIGSEDELAGISSGAVKLVNIDNFQGNSKFGDVVLVDGAFSSISEVCSKIIKDLNLPIDIDIAQNILDGVLFATRNFTKQNTSPLAFEAVSSAMYNGAQRKGEEQQQAPQRQSFQNQGRQQSQDRFTREQGFGQRQTQSNRGRDQRQHARQQRVSDTDFPAMHMQPKSTQQNLDNRQFGNMPMQQNPQQNRQQNVQQNSAGDNRQFGVNPNDMDELMKKIQEESKRHNQSQMGQNRNQSFGQRQNVQNDDRQNANVSVQDAEIIDDQPQPQEQSFENTQMPEEIPDDWLMPKVFKSSKNNN